MHTRTRGVSAIETAIGITLISLVLLFSINAITQFIATGSRVVAQTKALYLTEETLESARFIRDTNWTAFRNLALNTDLYISRAGGTLSVTTTPQTIDGFTPRFRLFAVNRDAVTDDIVTSGGVSDTRTRLMIATTSWSGGSATLSQYVMDMSP